MESELPSIGELELQVLQVVWRSQPCSERQVWEALKETREVGRTTVLKTLQRLEAKGVLARAASASPVQFRATLPEQRVLPALIRRFVDNVLGGSMDPLVHFFAGSDALTTKELDSLRRIARKLEQRERSRGD